MGGGNCDCGNCGGDGALVLLVVLAIVVVIILVIGLFFGILVGTVIVAKIAHRHLHVLAREHAARELIVADLDDPHQVRFADEQRDEMKGLNDEESVPLVKESAGDALIAPSKVPAGKKNANPYYDEV